MRREKFNANLEIVDKIASKQNLKLAIYGHGGSENHGNEAIVRGVKQLFPNADMQLFSFSPLADFHFELNDCATIKNHLNENLNIIQRIFIRVLKRLNILHRLWIPIWFKPLIKNIEKDRIYLLEAGDQYCEYSWHRRGYAYLNYKINRGGEVLSCLAVLSTRISYKTGGLLMI